MSVSIIVFLPAVSSYKSIHSVLFFCSLFMQAQEVIMMCSAILFCWLFLLVEDLCLEKIDIKASQVTITKTFSRKLIF